MHDKALISDSHADARWATRIQRARERCRVPDEIVAKHGPAVARA